jgi:ribonuclease HI
VDLTVPDLKVYVDGSGKNGTYCYVVAGSKPRIFTEGNLTNNQAEYKAIIAALRELSGEDLTVYSDSQLAVRQLDGIYRIKDPELRNLASRVHELCQYRKIHFKWIPRERNLAGKILEKII